MTRCALMLAVIGLVAAASPTPAFAAPLDLGRFALSPEDQSLVIDQRRGGARTAACAGAEPPAPAWRAARAAVSPCGERRCARVPSRAPACVPGALSLVRLSRAPGVPSLAVPSRVLVVPSPDPWCAPEPGCVPATIGGGPAARSRPAQRSVS